MDVVNAAFVQFPAVAIIGFFTVGLLFALLLFVACARVLRMSSLLRDYDAALEKLRVIEAKITEMSNASQQMQMDYERSLAAEKAAHEREYFGLQQIIFERNSEILTLKSTILELQS